MTYRYNQINLASTALPELRRRGLNVGSFGRDGLQPRIVHVGVGGFHRSHLAAYCDELANDGSDWGVCGVGLLPQDADMCDALAQQDFLYTLTTRDAHGSDHRVIQSLVGFELGLDDISAVVRRIAAPTTAILSLTVTEAGYDDSEASRRTFAIIGEGLLRRKEGGTGGLTVLSCDNLSANGDRARESLTAAVAAISTDLADWVSDNCSFPNSMVDRITPVTTEFDRRDLADTFGLIDRWPVRAERFRQWVVEDDFVAGRPKFETCGVIFTDDVESWERHKLRLLNAAHSLLAFPAALAGLETVDAVIADRSFSRFVEHFQATEAMPTLPALQGLDANEYSAEVRDRFANPAISDQVARLCTDGTSKVTTYLAPIIDDALDAGTPIDCIMFSVAAWSIYLATIEEQHLAADQSLPIIRPIAIAALDDPMKFMNSNIGLSNRAISSTLVTESFCSWHHAIKSVGVAAALEHLLGSSV